MKVKWKKLWIKALRSGKYQQARESLRFGDAYCCLGVLCKVVEPHGRWKRISHGGYQFKGEYSYPPKDIAKKVGMRQTSFLELGRLNDFDNLTFEQIAKYIQRHY